MISHEDDFAGRTPPRVLCPDEALRAIDNALRLTEYITAIRHAWGDCCSLTPDFLCECNRIVLDGIYAEAGTYRTAAVTVGDYVPPKAGLIPDSVVALCEFANQPELEAFHRAAYVLWRINWIHPFLDGNGRVAREVCYLTLQTGLGEDWPTGPMTIPERLDHYRDEYYAALRAADIETAGEGRPLALKELESLLLKCHLDQSASTFDD